MIEVKKYLPKEVVPQAELLAWRANLKKVEAENCPDEVRQFIAAVALKLPDFGQIGKERGSITGYELQLSGMKQFNGEVIDRYTIYELPIPKMVAVDYHTSMHRIFHRRGKQGLIDFVKAKVKGTEMEKLLVILNVHVFKQEREEYRRVMNAINESKKLDSI